MIKQECLVWRMLKEDQEKLFPGRISLALTSVELNPPVEISVLGNGYGEITSPMATGATPFPSSMGVYSQSPPAGINSYGTPVATPLAQTNESPDPSGGIMSTPGGTINADTTAEFDPDIRWMDSTDEIWAVVLNHRVPISTNIDPERGILFSIASGLLWPVKSPSNLIQVPLSVGRLT
jgi:Mediator complex subunit 13 C-terminal domain